MTAGVSTADAFEGRSRERLATLKRAPWLLFAVGAAVAAALILWLGRGRTFSADELTWFMQTPDVDLEGAFDPHGGHLILTTRLVYKAVLETLGVGYLPFQLLTLATVVLAAGLFFAYAGRRVGTVVALGPTLILLVFGSDAAHLMSGNGFTVLGATACGLGALLALDRSDRTGDVVACALLCLGVVTYTVALAFVVGVAASVLLRDDRWRRIWIVAVPTAIYGAWWLWSLRLETSSESQISPDDALLFPAWAFQSLSAVLGALTGLDYDFSDSTAKAGPALALLAIVALGWRLWRGSVPTTVWAALGIVATLWMMGAISRTPFRLPDSSRYLYPGAVAVLLVATWTVAGSRWKRPALISLYLIVATSLATNIALLRDSGAQNRAAALSERAELTGIELAGEHANPAYVPADASFAVGFAIGQGRPAGVYLAASDRYGSIGYSVEELRGQGEAVKELADQRLAEALALGLSPTEAGIRGRDCVEVGTGGVPSLELTAGQAAVLESDEDATVQVRRFATLSAVDVGNLAPGEAATLALPADGISEPWQVTTSAPIRACLPR